MERLNQRLAASGEQRSRLMKLKRHTAELAVEVERAQRHADELARTLAKEERDVERMEGLSLSNLLASLRGDKEERLLQERQEAAAAQLRFEEARVRVERLQVERVERELASMQGVESEYQALLVEKERSLQQSGGEGAQQLHGFAEQEQQIAWRLKELDEARRAGQQAEQALGSVASSLESARSWGTWDMLGGGWIATAAKHNHMDEARAEVYRAQEALARFRRELKDVATDIPVPVVAEIEGFARFADYFFDGLFADIAVQNRINDSLASVNRSREQVNNLLHWLAQQVKQAQAESVHLQDERQRFLERYQGD